MKKVGTYNIEHYQYNWIILPKYSTFLTTSYRSRCSICFISEICVRSEKDCETSIGILHLLKTCFKKYTNDWSGLCAFLSSYYAPMRMNEMIFRILISKKNVLRTSLLKSKATLQLLTSMLCKWFQNFLIQKIVVWELTLSLPHPIFAIF